MALDDKPRKKMGPRDFFSTKNSMTKQPLQAINEQDFSHIIKVYSMPAPHQPTTPSFEQLEQEFHRAMTLLMKLEETIKMWSAFIQEASNVSEAEKDILQTAQIGLTSDAKKKRERIEICAQLAQKLNASSVAINRPLSEQSTHELSVLDSLMNPIYTEPLQEPSSSIPYLNAAPAEPVRTPYKPYLHEPAEQQPMRPPDPLPEPIPKATAARVSSPPAAAAAAPKLSRSERMQRASEFAARCLRFLNAQEQAGRTLSFQDPHTLKSLNLLSVYFLSPIYTHAKQDEPQFQQEQRQVKSWLANFITHEVLHPASIQDPAILKDRNDIMINSTLFFSSQLTFNTSKASIRETELFFLNCIKIMLSSESARAALKKTGQFESLLKQAIDMPIPMDSDKRLGVKKDVLVLAMRHYQHEILQLSQEHQLNANILRQAQTIKDMAVQIQDKMKGIAPHGPHSSITAHYDAIDTTFQKMMKKTRHVGFHEETGIRAFDPKKSPDSKKRTEGTRPLNDLDATQE